MAWFTDIFSAIAQGLGLANTVQSEQNTPEMQARKGAANTESSKTKIEQDVAAADVEEIRKDIAE